MPADRRRNRELHSGIQDGDDRDDPFAGWYRRLDGDAGGSDGGSHMTKDINHAEVVAEVAAAFEAYERALVDNDTALMNRLFWDAPQTVRYGISEIQHGGEAIRQWRNSCDPVPKSRRLRRTVITAFGDDFATV